MNKFVAVALVALMCATVPATALTFATGTIALSASDPTQLGRISRDGVPADWSSDKAFPGIVNAATRYAYQTIAISFAPNATQDVYYQISIDDVATFAFASAYRNAYDPTNLALNYLGDPGTSGNYFGVDPLFFQVKVTAGDSLVLNFNQTVAGSFSSPAYVIEAFSDTEYNEVFGAVPEPATWALLLIGFGGAGAALRVRRQALRAAAA